MNEKQFRRILIGIYAFRISFGGMACAIPIIALFWKAHGMSLTQIMILQSFFALLLVLLEVPSGYAADLWGRKNVLVCASLFLSCGSGIYLFANTYSHFVMAEIAFALAISLISGADSALLYDALKERNQQEQYTRIWGSVQAVSLISCALFTSTGGIFYEYAIRLPFIVAFGITLGTIPSALLLHESMRLNQESAQGYIRGLWTILYPAIAKNRGYRELLLTHALVFTFVQAGLWFYQPYLQLCGIEPFWFGFIFMAFNLVAALASKSAEQIDRHTKGFPFGALALILIALTYCGMSVLQIPLGFTVIFLQQLVRGWFSVSISHRVNRLIQSQHRATLLSFCSMSSSCAYALFIPFAGMIADTFSVAIALGMCGLLCLIIAGAGLLKAGFGWRRALSLSITAD